MILVPFEPEVRDRICRSLCANFGFGALVAFVVLRSSPNRPRFGRRGVRRLGHSEIVGAAAQD
jgi:hypothetical protein